MSRRFATALEQLASWERAAARGAPATQVVANPWRAAAPGEEFRVAQGINYATRNADYYRRKYQLEFACRAVPAVLGGGTIVRRVR